MAWEALRLTSRSPSEVFGVLGPHGVEELICKARDCIWRGWPAETRSMGAVRGALTETFERNMGVWKRIKKPTPEAFFAEMGTNEADHLVRQALVTCWMMLPRAGGRDFKDVAVFVRGIFDRVMEGWEADNATFTGKKAGRKKGRKAKPTKRGR